jgi:hypothetical protein
MSPFNCCCLSGCHWGCPFGVSWCELLVLGLELWGAADAITMTGCYGGCGGSDGGDGVNDADDVCGAAGQMMFEPAMVSDHSAL